MPHPSAGCPIHPQLYRGWVGEHKPRPSARCRSPRTPPPQPRIRKPEGGGGFNPRANHPQRPERSPARRKPRDRTFLKLKPSAPSIRSFIADGWESTNLDPPHDAARPELLHRSRAFESRREAGVSTPAQITPTTGKIACAAQAARSYLSQTQAECPIHPQLYRGWVGEHEPRPSARCAPSHKGCVKRHIGPHSPRPLDKRILTPRAESIPPGDIGVFQSLDGSAETQPE